MAKEPKKPAPGDIWKEPPMGTGPGGEVMLFNSIEEARQWKKDHPLIVLDPEDDGDIPDIDNYNDL